MKVLISALILIVHSAHAEVIKCDLSPDNVGERISATSVYLSLDADKHSMLASAEVESPYGTDFYEHARDHSGGGSYSTINGVPARYYSTDYCVDWDYKTKIEGPFWNRREVITGFSCKLGSPEISVMKIYPENGSASYVNSVSVSDSSSKILGSYKSAKFDKCKVLKNRK